MRVYIYIYTYNYNMYEPRTQYIYNVIYIYNYCVCACASMIEHEYTMNIFKRASIVQIGKPWIESNSTHRNLIGPTFDHIACQARTPVSARLQTPRPAPRTLHAAQTANSGWHPNAWQWVGPTCYPGVIFRWHGSNYRFTRSGCPE